MWMLFPELLVPMIAAFLVGSLLAWVVVGMVLPRKPDEIAGGR